MHLQTTVDASIYFLVDWCGKTLLDIECVYRHSFKCLKRFYLTIHLIILFVINSDTRNIPTTWKISEIKWRHNDGRRTFLLKFWCCPWWTEFLPNIVTKLTKQDFPGGTVDKNLPANAGDTGSTPGLGRCL